MCEKCDTLRDKVRKLVDDAIANDEQLNEDRSHTVATVAAVAMDLLLEETKDPFAAENAARMLFGNAASRFVKKQMDTPEYKAATEKMAKELEEALAEKMLRDMPEAKMVH